MGDEELIEVLEWALQKVNHDIEQCNRVLSLWGDHAEVSTHAKDICDQARETLAELEKHHQTIRRAIRHEGEND